MKNSKVLSLLTAAALVVSSFSGLAMNGNVARAALETTKSNYVSGVGATYYNEAQGYQLLTGEQFTVTVPGVSGKVGFAAFSAPAGEPGVGAPARHNGDAVMAAPVNGNAILGNTSFSTLAGNTGSATYTAGAAGGGAGFIEVGHADAAPAAATAFPADTTSWWRVNVGTVAAQGNVNIGLFEDADCTIPVTEIRLEQGKINNIPLYVKLTSANGNYINDAAAITGWIDGAIAGDAFTLTGVRDTPGLTAAFGAATFGVVRSLDFTSAVDTTDRRIGRSKITLTVDCRTVGEGEYVEFTIANYANAGAAPWRAVVGRSTEIDEKVSYVDEAQNPYYDQLLSSRKGETKTFKIEKTKDLQDLFGANLTESATDVSVQYTLNNAPDGLSLDKYDSTTIGADNTTNYNLLVKSLAQGVTVKWAPTAGATVTVQPTLTAVGSATGKDGKTYTFTKTWNLFTEFTNRDVNISMFKADGTLDHALTTTEALTEATAVNWYNVSYNEGRISLSATDFANVNGDPAATTRVTAIYELLDTTYAKFNGDYAGKRVTVGPVNSYDPATTPSDRVYVDLTDAGKNVTTDVYVDMKVTLIYGRGTNSHVAGVTDYATSSTRLVKFLIKGTTDFEVALFDENGEQMPDTIAWDIDDMAAVTKAPKVAQVRSLNNINIGAGGTDAYVVFTMTGDTSAFGVEYQSRVDALGAWNNENLAADGTSIKVNDNIFRIYTTGASNKSATLKMVVTAGSNRAVKTYTLTTKIASLSISTWDSLAVGEELDLTKDVTVKYNGNEVTGSIDWKVDSGDSQITYLNKKIKVTKAGKKFTITATYKEGVNTTAVASKTISTVEKLSVTPSSLKLTTGESVNISDMAISGGNGSYAWEILEGENIATTTGKVLKANQAGDAKVRVKDTAGNYAVVAISVSGGTTPEPQPGDDVVESGVYAKLNSDLKTVTVYAAEVANGVITIPVTVGGYDVVAIANQAFKGTDAKQIIVEAPVTSFGKGAFKKSKVKNIYFMQADKLASAGKNAFKGNKTKVWSVGADFSADMTKELKKMSGVKKVKNVASVQ